MKKKEKLRLQQQQNSSTANENGDLLNDHPTNNNNKGINMKRKYQVIAQNLLRKNLPPWEKFSSNTKGISILPGGVLL